MLLLPACAGAPAEVTPVSVPAQAASHHGVVVDDDAPPAGAELHQRPSWRVGDEFVLERGGVARARFRVLSADGGAYTLGSDAPVVVRRDLDLGNLGEWSVREGRPVRAMVPVDARFHWPLWVGKTWRCAYDEIHADGRTVPMEARYTVEALDTVAVPAGTFAALRIVRRARRLDAEAAPVHTHIVWYAPGVGHEVRQVFGDQSVELVEYRKGG